MRSGISLHLEQLYQVSDATSLYSRFHEQTQYIIDTIQTPLEMPSSMCQEEIGFFFYHFEKS